MAKFYCPIKLSENISETPEGYLLCVGVPIARTGEMEYGEGETPLEVGEDGRVYVSRDAKEVFDKKTMASFEGKPVTIKHPEEFVTPENWARLAKGAVQNVRKSPDKDENGEETLLADLLITDSFAISLVKNGLREVSCGYEAEYEQTGEGKGRQSKIVGNHLALVEEGRAGSSYAIVDHKGKVAMGNKIGEKLKKLIGKTIDEAVAEGEKAAKETTKTKDKGKTKDDQSTPKASKGAGSETNKVFDAEAYKAMKDAYDAMGKQLDAMKPVSDADKEEEESEDDGEEEESEDDGDDQKDSEILERVKALEAAIAKLLPKDDAEEEESEDEDLEGEEGESSQKKKTGDSKAKDKKRTGLEETKNADSFESFDSKTEEMTPEKMNELNEKHWARK